MFPYHYGSHATTHIHTGGKKSLKAFPYHYGSYATSSQNLSTHSSEPQVSIPLWFLRNPLLLQRYYTGFGEAESTNWKDLVSNIEFAFQRFAWILIIDGLSAKWREKASVSSKEDRSQKIPARHSPVEAYRRKALPISLSIK